MDNGLQGTRRGNRMGSGEILVKSRGERKMLVVWTRDKEEEGDDVKFRRQQQKGVTKKLAVPVSPYVLCVYIHHSFIHSFVLIFMTR